MTEQKSVCTVILYSFQNASRELLSKVQATERFWEMRIENPAYESNMG